MSEPLVSVIMAVYNEEPYLVRAIKSVLTQSFEDYELIIVDDASTDGSPKIIEDLKNERTIVMRNTENIGKAACLNRALEVAKGKYLLELDGDDWLDRDALEQLIEAREALEGETGLMISGVQEFRQRRRSAEYRRTRKPPEQVDRNSLLLGSHKLGCRLWLAEAVREVGGWKIDDWTQGRAFENWVLAVEISAKYPVASVDLTVYNARRHQKNMSDRLKHQWLNVRNWVLENNLSRPSSAVEEEPGEEDNEKGYSDGDEIAPTVGSDEEMPEQSETGNDETAGLPESFPRPAVARGKPVFYPQAGPAAERAPREPRQEPSPVKLQDAFSSLREGQGREPVPLASDSLLSDVLLESGWWQSPDVWKGANSRTALVPVGILQFGRGHIPVGSSILRAMAYARAAVSRTGGVVLPPLAVGTESTQSWGFFQPIEVDQEALRAGIHQTMKAVGRAGIARVVVIVSPPDRGIFDALDKVLREGGNPYRGKVWIFNEQEIMRNFGARSYVGEWESSILMALEENLVQLKTAGSDSRQGAQPSAEKGREILEEVGNYISLRLQSMRSR